MAGRSENGKYNYATLGRAPKAERDEKGRFLPGSVPNPSGQGKAYRAFSRLCREYSEEALEKVISIMRGEVDISVVSDGDGGVSVEKALKLAPSAAIQLDAAKYVCDRAYGKPTQVKAEKEAPSDTFSGIEEKEAVRLLKRQVAKYEDEHGEVLEH